MKSNESSYLELVRAVYKDACAKCTADVSDLRDLKYIESRVREEGLSFLTITLPAFARSFEKCLAEGCVTASAFPRFRRTGAIPSFLKGMLGRIFDQETGRLISDESSTNSSDVPTLVLCIRQLCLVFKKLELGCTSARTQKSLENFTEIETLLKSLQISDEAISYFGRVSALLWDNLIGPIKLDEVKPRHGPGATADRLHGNEKYVWQRWHERLEVFLPYLGNAMSIGVYKNNREFQVVSFVPEDGEQPVRVVPVPKDLKGPRIIAIEPVCMQFVQQGVRDVLYRVLEQSWPTRGHLNFSDQSINQDLAISSSRTGRLATIDLSDASDRVPYRLALSMFDSNPDLRDLIDACRSTTAEMPDGSVIPLNKFASMGSALCFPVEAMYFYTICVGALLESRNLPLSLRSLHSVCSDIYVYGDDILVPSHEAVVVFDHLQKYNCKVNSNKTFWTGKFRESCGADAFDGELVTPVYLRKCFPEGLHQPDRLVSWVRTAQQFYLAGYWSVARFMYDVCESFLGPLPWVDNTSPALGRVSFLGYRTAHRWNGDLQAFEQRAWVGQPVYRTDELKGYAALSKSLLGLEQLDESVPASRDAQHMERSALHGAVALKLRWVPVHYGEAS